MFRLAWGFNRFNNDSASDKMGAELYSFAKNKIEQLKKLPLDKIQSMDESYTQDITVGKKEVAMTVYRVNLENSKVLVVLQFFFFTLTKANVISLGSIGQLSVDGFIVEADGKITSASDDMLFEYH